MANNVHADTLSEPLNGTTTATVAIDTGIGNLTIDTLTDGEPVLANGTLQYLEKQGHPTHTLMSSNGQTTLTLKGESTGRPWFRFPWTVCAGAYEWQIHLNPEVTSGITAHSDGGNIKLALAGMAVTHVLAETGGGNMDVVLPDNAADLQVTAKTGGGNVTVDVGSGLTGSSAVEARSGAGNVVVHVPGGLPAKVHATTGLGNATVDPQFRKIDRNTYESPGYDGSADKVEITVSSGAGNVTVNTK